MMMRRSGSRKEKMEALCATWRARRGSKRCSRILDLSRVHCKMGDVVHAHEVPALLLSPIEFRDASVIDTELPGPLRRRVKHLQQIRSSSGQVSHAHEALSTEKLMNVE